MASADVASPVDLLADRAVGALDFHATFLTETAVPAASPKADGNDAGTAPGTDPGARDYVFPLKSEAFTNLQAYLVAGMKLPENQAAFELEYPRSLLEEYTKKESDVFYDKMCKVLTDINNHCVEFKKGTMNNAVKLGGSIASFADEATQASKTLFDSLTVITKPGARTDDPVVEAAFTNFSTAMDSLLKRARASKKGCEEAYAGLGVFRDITAKDKIEIDKIDVIVDKILPKTADLDSDMKRKMDEAYEKLNEIVKEQNRIMKTTENLRRILGWLPLFGAPIAISAIVRNSTAGIFIQKQLQEFENLFNSCNAEVQKGLRLRVVTKNLGSAIDEVVNTIKHAEEALQNMIGAFSNLVNNLQNLDDDLSNAFDAVQSKLSFKRKGAFTHLNKAGKVWPLVLNLARDFEQNGQPLIQDIDAKSLQSLPSVMEILATTYGGVDNTLYSQVLFNSGPDIKIRSVEPGFPEPWDGVDKSISVLHKYGESMRIFACREYSGTHYLKPGAPQTIDWYNVQLREVLPMPKNPKSEIEILAVVWAQAIITDEKVYQKIHDAYANKGKVSFTNEGIGGGSDPWSGNRKSGAIYYKVVGGDTIRQISGKEGAEVAFP